MAHMRSKGYQERPLVLTPHRIETLGFSIGLYRDYLGLFGDYIGARNGVYRGYIGVIEL